MVGQVRQSWAMGEATHILRQLSMEMGEGHGARGGSNRRKQTVDGGGWLPGQDGTDLALMSEEHSSRQAKCRSPAREGMRTQEDQYSGDFPSLCSPRISQDDQPLITGTT